MAVVKVKVEAYGETSADCSRQLHAVRNLLGRVQAPWVDAEVVELSPATAMPNGAYGYRGRMTITFIDPTVNGGGFREQTLTASKVDVVIEHYGMNGTPEWVFDDEMNDVPTWPGVASRASGGGVHPAGDMGVGRTG